MFLTGISEQSFIRDRILENEEKVNGSNVWLVKIFVNREVK